MLINRYLSWFSVDDIYLSILIDISSKLAAERRLQHYTLML